MATGIRQQIRGVVNRARNYWAELTDGATHRTQSGQREIDEAVHERYGGRRGPEDDARLHERQARTQESQPASRSSPPAGSAMRSNPAAGRSVPARPGRGQQGSGSHGIAGQQMQADMAERPYTQPGSNPTRKPSNETPGGSDAKRAVRGSGRAPGQRQP